MITQELLAKLTYSPIPESARASSKGEVEFLKPGMVLRDKEGSLYCLLGDLNTMLGLCDCCSMRLEDFDAYADISELFKNEEPEK